MAIIFEMWAECGGEEECQALAAHFDGLRHTLLTGREVRWEASVERSPLGVLVSSRDLSSFGVRSVADAVETTEAGLRLYAHLRSAPPFRFARVAWEAWNVQMAELGDYVSRYGDGECRIEVECVMDDALHRALGSPKLCHEFRPGYRWTRYRGESYRPLYANDQPALNGLCRELHPEYFAY